MSILKNKTAMENILAKVDAKRDEVRAAFLEGDQARAEAASAAADAMEAEFRALFAESVAGSEDDEVAAAAAATPVRAERTQRMADIFLGPESAFDERTFDLHGHYRKVVDEALDLPTPVTVEEGLPTTGLQPMGFLSTIPSGSTRGDIVFPAPAPDTNRLIAPTWQKGRKKPPQTLSFESRKAFVEWVAYSLPVSEVALKDYGQLRSIIETELRNGYIRSQDFYAVQGNNPNGIVGVLDDLAGIPTFDKSQYEGANIFDVARIMLGRIVMTTGHTPTHIAISPLLREQMDLMKTGDGLNTYLGLSVSGRIWNLPLVDDVYFADFKPDGSAEDAFMMVYDRNAFTWYTQHGVALDMAYVNDQFLVNETTLRLEASHALKIADPRAAIKCKFSIAEADRAILANVSLPAPANGVSVLGHGDALGMDASEFGHFQISGESIRGGARMVTGYTGYSKTAKLQSGRFMALKVDEPEGRKVYKTPGVDKGSAKELDADGKVIVRLGDDAIDVKSVTIVDADGTETNYAINVVAE